MGHPRARKFEVAVLGGGVSGAAVFYALAKYADIGSLCLVEKCGRLGRINSHGDNNSQTLHFGDIETNYSLDKARTTKAASEMVVAYLESLGEGGRGIYEVGPKMALAVGTEEVAALTERHARFAGLFPESRLIDREEIAAIEPEIVRGRPANEPLAACHSTRGYTVDFGRLAESLAKEGLEAHARAEVLLDTAVSAIEKTEAGYLVRTSQGEIEAEAVVVAMCAHSLIFAKALGYGQDYAILPVGGNFYASARPVLRGKVYTMQSGKLPFAAVHGDPVLGDGSQTRFGPTANIMPFLERNSLKTFFDFYKSSAGSLGAIVALSKVIFEPVLFGFLLRSLVYELPWFGPRAFARLAKKIVPSLAYADFKNGKTKAGIRPQLVDIKNKKLLMGELEIVGDRIIFGVTPSPGATACLANAKRTARQVAAFFEGRRRFDQAAFERDLG